MQEYKKQFLFILKTAINNETLPDGYQFDVSRVFQLAGIHNVVPFIYLAASSCRDDVASYKAPAVWLCARQVEKNENFRRLYQRITASGITPLVVKGPVCGECYTDSSLRLSSDFDLIVKDENFSQLHNIFISEGFECKNNAYTSADKSLYIELSSRFGECDDFYAEKADAFLMQWLDNPVYSDMFATIPYNEHLYYLFYHAFKHFIGSGFGVRQIADIYMYIKYHNDRLDYAEVAKMLEMTGIKTFADNVMQFISEVFEFNCQLTDTINEKYICLDDFMTDVIDAGVFGKSTEDRLHSATVVQNAVRGGGRKSVIKSLFPSLEYMQGRFSILRKLPFLLPLMWLVRIFMYFFSSAERNRSVSPANSIKIATERIDLMKKIGII